MSNSPSNSKQSADGNMPSIMIGALTKFLRGEVDDMLPARVISYDAAACRATIQPVIQLGTTDGKKISRAAVYDVPVYRFGGGGLVISVPLKAGDLGWLKASYRDLSLFKQHGVEDWPNTERLHSFEDAMFFPDAMRNVVLGDQASLCIQTIDGKSGVFITPAGVIAMKTPGAQIVMSGGNIDITSATLTHNGINIGSTHTHTGPATAPNGPVSNTGAPIPS